MPLSPIRFDPETGTVGGDAVALGKQSVSSMSGRLDAQRAAEQAAATPAPEAALPVLSGRMVDVLDPMGRPGQMPAESLEQAKALGYREETPDQKQIREYLDENKGLKGSLKVGAGQAVDELLMGLPELVFEHKGDPFEVAKWDALKKDHDLANALGGTLGFGGSLLLPGLGEVSAAGKATKGAVLGTELAEKALVGQLATKLEVMGAEKAVAAAAAPSLARKMLASAAGTGVEGALISAPRAITEAALGDPEAAAESLVYGAGLGAVLGGAGALIKGGANKVTRAIEEHGGLREMAGKFGEQRAFNSLASNHASLKLAAKKAATIEGGVEGVGRMLLDENLVRGLREDVGDYAARVVERREQVGSDIGALWRRADELAPGGGIKADDFAAKVEEQILAPLYKTPGMRDVAAQVGGYMEQFNAAAQAEGGTISLEKMHEWRQALDKLVFRTEKAAPGTKIDELRDVRRFMKTDMEESIAKLSETVGEDLVGTLKDKNLLFSRLKAAEAAAVDYAEVRAPSNRALSPTDYGVGSVVGGASTMLGNPLGFATGIGASMAHNFVRTEGSGILARAADSFSKGGVLFAEQTMKHAAVALDRIPKELEGLAASKKAEASDAMRSLVGLKGAGGTRLENFEKVSEKLSTYASDPAKMADDIAKIAGKLADGGAPKIAEAYTMKMQQSFDYLLSQLPKPPGPDSPLTRMKWKPSDRQIAEFERKAAVMLDPFSVVRRINDSTLTRPEVDALKAVYPKIYDAMIGRINAYAFDPERAKPMTYGKRLKLSLLTGQDFDVNISPQAVRATQSNYQQNTQQGPKSGPQLKAPDVMTDAQRISNR